MKRINAEKKTQTFAHPIKLGKDPTRWKNTVVAIQEEVTTNPILQNNNEIRWKRRAISVVFLETVSPCSRHKGFQTLEIRVGRCEL